MKIALVCPYSFTRPGGVKTHVLALKDQFVKKGHEVKIIIPRQTESESYGKDIIILGKSISIPGNSSVADISISFELGKKSVKSILSKEKFDIIHFHEPLVPFMSMQILNISETKNVATFHAYIEKDKVFEYIEPVVKNLKKHFLPKINAAIAVSQLAKKYYEKDYKGKIRVIPNGIDTKKFKPGITPLVKKDNNLKVLFVGRLEERKGITYLLKSWVLIHKAFPEIKLIIAGSGPLKEEVEKFIEDNNLSASIIMLGFIENSDLPGLYNSADIFCAPATHAESFGIVLLEAMATGIPIVAYSNKGYSLVLDNIKDYSLAKNKSTKDLAQKLIRLINDEKIREELSKWGLNEAQKYDWDIISDKVLDVYKEVLNGG